MLVRVILLVVGASLALAQEFPLVKDWKSVRITLERTSCFGSCPAYTVEIRDGEVRYRGVYSTAVLGERKGKITRPELQQLVDEFRADYRKLASLSDDEKMDGSTSKIVAVQVMDAPTSKISVSIDGSSNTFVDSGIEPKAEIAPVKALAEAIDRLAHTDQWVKGGRATTPLTGKR